jgi:anti-sigma factor RsiW
MSCRNFETTITELARGQMMEARVKEDARAHMETCKRCAAHYADEKMLTAGLHAVAASAASTEAPARVEAALLKAFRQGATTPFVSTHAPSAQTKAMPWLPWSIAAAVAFLIFSAFALPRLLPPNTRELAKQEAVGAQSKPFVSPMTATPESEQEDSETQSEIAATSEEEADDVSSSPRSITRRRALMQNAGLRDRSTRSGNNLAAATGANEEIATEFLPITYGGNLPQLDDGQVVRVELPRSALQSFGLPVNAERAGERVKADVLLGHDGVARAIRFVR